MINYSVLLNDKYFSSYSEMCTKMSSPPSLGMINPCPLLRLKLFTVPWINGFLIARSHLDMKHIENNK